MKRRLIVMRHAKSSWKSGVGQDHARPLNDRGRRDAPRVAARLAELGWTPLRVLSSDSQRTRETWRLMKEAFDPTPEVAFLKTFYLAGIDAIREEGSQVPPQVDSLLVLGHNPGWEDAVGWLSGTTIGMTTANAALLQGEGATWEEALSAASAWQLATVLRPKEL